MRRSSMSEVESLSLGVVVTEVGFTLARDPDTVRGPDLAFVRRDRLPPSNATGFFEGPPDLTVEVLSPDDRLRERSKKVEDYLTRGVTLVMVIDPDKRTATMFRRLAPPVTSLDQIDLDDVIPGFRCSLLELLDRA